MQILIFHRLIYPLMGVGNYHSADAESGCKVIANERGVEPRKADNLG
jgi:hypothetical protein